jgi:hypothetical protein
MTGGWVMDLKVGRMVSLAGLVLNNVSMERENPSVMKLTMRICTTFESGTNPESWKNQVRNSSPDALF